MIISFEGKTLEEIKTEVREFLGMKVENATPEEEERTYTIVEVRAEVNATARKIGRDKTIEALKRIDGSESVTGLKPENYAAVMEWCHEQG